MHGEKIKILRKQKGFSQFQLEDMINASPGTLCRIEKGIVNPTKETLYRISLALDLSAEETIDLFCLKELIFEKQATKAPTWFYANL